ncbi:ATP-dependent protease ATPase subunit HslU [Mahella australiensis]|uniref:ATP-dependent protease ATPase subunit HslU n=1 Tax=Mahella australiensis (strain DSM 15567 / CIP 107919 / 50-1 BON) TaxID=697281 RepID=F4A1L1_MAHA5|nr:ATP-dependent protease ATPase subunit HslU [Mahella australiensis]AEE96045.1 heat shock protein HslVU, ATPase subunit HslU [Mahella australiensis 50-1 BON]
MEYTPKEIVKELDKYIIGQHKAKKAVAVALRNRYRRNLLPQEMREEIMPKNIIMMGPTGVGKTEIARRLAKLVNAPFIKVEATKYTEVGYVGRDVESMVRDLVEVAIRMVKNQKMSEVADRAKQLAEERLLDVLLPPRRKRNSGKNPLEAFFGGQGAEDKEDEESETLIDNSADGRLRMKEMLDAGELDGRYIEIEVQDNAVSGMGIFSAIGMDDLAINMQDMFGNLFPKKTKKRRVTVKEARRIFEQEEAQKLIDMDEVTEEALNKAEQEGIIFIDELDKVAGREGGAGPDVSREGVQRDILPIVEGTTVMTKYGPVKTDYMLFIAAGAFHVAKVSDLIPELQGRFPVLVQLDSLSQQDFKQILTQPQNALIKQYKALMSADNLELEFTDDAIDEIARMAYVINENNENIGARRLHTVMERLLEDISYEMPVSGGNEIIVDKAYVQGVLKETVQDKDISKYIL